MEKLFILILAIAAAIFVALPFFRKRPVEIPQDINSSNTLEHKLRRLNSEKESHYAALKELDFDYSMGKLSREDYDELEKKYKAEALAVLKQIDNIQLKTNKLNLEEETEKEIKAVRESKLTDDEIIEKEILKARQSNIKVTSGLICSECGNEYKSSDRFCSNCGARVYE